MGNIVGLIVHVLGNLTEMKKKIWEKAAEKIGKENIDDIIIEKLPIDHPKVIAMLKKKV